MNKAMILGGVLAVSCAGTAWAQAGAGIGNDENTEVLSFFVGGPNGENDGFFVTHGGNVPIPLVPEGIPPVRGKGDVNTGFTMMAKLRDENFNIVGVASEIEWFPEGGGRGREWEAWWTIHVPGRGSIIGHEMETIPFHDDYFIQDATARHEDWTGEFERRMAAGPRPDGWGVIVGGTGEWEGVSGRFSEVIHVTGMTAEGKRSSQLELRYIIEK